MPQKHRGRPTTDNPKTERIDVRLTEEEVQMLDKYCQQAGVSRPQGLRDGIKALNAEKWKGSGVVGKRIYTTSIMPPAQGESHKYYTLFGSVLQAIVNKIERTDNGMGKILDAFLTDQLRMDNVIGQRNPEHQRLYKRGDELQNRLAEKLKDEDKAILTELMNIIADEGCYDAEAKLQYGFRLGVLMITEIFTEQDMFFRTDNDCVWSKRIWIIAYAKGHFQRMKVSFWTLHDFYYKNPNEKSMFVLDVVYLNLKLGKANQVSVIRENSFSCFNT